MKFCLGYSAVLLIAGFVGHEMRAVLEFLALAWYTAFIYNLDRRQS